MPEPLLPTGLVPGRHTPVFDTATLPEPLAEIHRTTVWATLHVRTGSVRYIDVEGADPRDLRLVAGDRAVIAPRVGHKIEPSTDATFFIQFYRRPDEEPAGPRPTLRDAGKRQAGPWVHRGRDLDTEDEIFEMVTRQYSDIVQDDLLAPSFMFGPGFLDWKGHIATVTDFWCHVLLYAPDYDIDVIESHRHLHDQKEFTPVLFDRWLQIFVDAVDGGWTGPNATWATKRATGLARAMALRFLGSGAWTPSPAGAEHPEDDG